MWLCDPEQSRGCHVEMHMFLGTLKKQKKVDGYLKNNLFEPRTLFQRHEDLKEEMLRRGYNHKSNVREVECGCVLDLPEEKQYWKIDKEAALKDLLSRCPKCKERYDTKK
jgi:hypothetical protein